MHTSRCKKIRTQCIWALFGDTCCTTLLIGFATPPHALKHPCLKFCNTVSKKVTLFSKRYRRDLDHWVLKVLFFYTTFWTSFVAKWRLLFVNFRFLFAHVWNVQFDEKSTAIGDKWHSKSMTVGSKNRAFKKNALYFCQFMQSIELKTW
jgi:hypothetical protein